MWEIYSEGRTPFENCSNLDVVNDITRGVRLYRPYRATQALYAIMYRCWHEVLTEPVRQSLFHLLIHSGIHLLTGYFLNSLSH